MSKLTVGDRWKSVIAVLLLIVSIFVALFVLQVTQLWDWLNPMTRRMATWPVLAPHVEMYRVGRDRWRVAEAEREALDERQLELDGRAARLNEEQRQLASARNELELERARLTEWERQLNDRQLAVEQLEDGAEALDRLRDLYAAMRPQEAATIMSDMQEDEIAALLADMAPRQAGSILAALPRDKAAAVSRALGL